MAATATSGATVNYRAPDFQPEITVSPRADHDSLFFWQFMVAGSIAGSVEHMAMFPLDTLKTRMQALGSGSGPVLGVRSSLSSILKLEGPAGLYRGIWAMWLGAGPAHAVRVRVLQGGPLGLEPEQPCGPRSVGGLHDGGELRRDNAHGHGEAEAAAGGEPVQGNRRLREACAGGGGSVRILPVIQDDGGDERAVHRGAVRIVRGSQESPAGAIPGDWHRRRGNGCPCDGRGPGRCSHHPTGCRQDSAAVPGFYPNTAILACLLHNYMPLMNLLMLIEQGVCGCHRFTSSSFGDVIQLVPRKDGYGGLMRGWVQRMLFHAPAAAICWSTYEASKSLFQKLNNTKNPVTD